MIVSGSNPLASGARDIPDHKLQHAWQLFVSLEYQVQVADRKVQAVFGVNGLLVAALSFQSQSTLSQLRSTGISAFDIVGLSLRARCSWVWYASPSLGSDRAATTSKRQISCRLACPVAFLLRRYRRPIGAGVRQRISRPLRRADSRADAASGAHRGWHPSSEVPLAQSRHVRLDGFTGVVGLPADRASHFHVICLHPETGTGVVLGSRSVLPGADSVIPSFAVQYR